MLILILTVRFKFRMLWLLALTCQCISHFSLVNGPQGNREMPNKLMIGPDQSLLFNFRRNHLRTRPPAQFIYFQNCLAHFIFHFSFWLTKLQKTKKGYVILYTMLGKMKMKNNNRKTVTKYFRFS